MGTLTGLQDNAIFLELCMAIISAIWLFAIHNMKEEERQERAMIRYNMFMGVFAFYSCFVLILILI